MTCVIFYWFSIFNEEFLSTACKMQKLCCNFQKYLLLCEYIVIEMSYTYTEMLSELYMLLPLIYLCEILDY